MNKKIGDFFLFFPNLLKDNEYLPSTIFEFEHPYLEGNSIPSEIIKIIKISKHSSDL
jgi:hypothetical protein